LHEEGQFLSLVACLDPGRMEQVSRYLALRVGIDMIRLLLSNTYGAGLCIFGKAFGYLSRCPLEDRPAPGPGPAMQAEGQASRSRGRTQLLIRGRGPELTKNGGRVLRIPSPRCCHIVKDKINRIKEKTKK